MERPREPGEGGSPVSVHPYLNITPESQPEMHGRVGADGVPRYRKRICWYAGNGWYNDGLRLSSLYRGGSFLFVGNGFPAGKHVLRERIALQRTVSFDYSLEEGIMSDKRLEIRWHGRGGQGAKTACMLLADAAFAAGKYVQGFPEYGPERMGAPITAYNRISDERCSVHSYIYNPDYVVVVDETLLSSVDVTHGLKEDGAVVINSAKPVSELRPYLHGYEGEVYTIDARKISEECLGAYFPNTPMLAAVVEVSKVLDPDRFVQDMEASFQHKFATKPQVIEGNMRCLEESMKEVRAQ